ncbi:MAG: hypothetical protein IPF54_22945 [Draconibacterium sp.]|nr:hypothetical protein [Draconibacterium sp.]
MENLLGYIECTPADTSKSSSMWLIEETGDGFVRIKSELNKMDFIHVENLQNQAQYGTVETTWWSAMWELEPVIVTSVAEYAFEKNVKIYPNPSAGNSVCHCMNSQIMRK